MRRSAKRPVKIGLLFVLVATAALTATAFTAANTVPATNAGDGNAAISGYTISNVNYTLNAANPQNLDAVVFDILPVSASTIRVQVDTVAGTWYTCANAAGTVTCATTAPQATVLAANQLTVVATD
ncbi:MAG: hypothetical protein ACR2OD_08375 [Gaiellaceae bacterium]